MKNLLVTFLVLIIFQITFAQNVINKNLFELYDSQNFEQLESELAKLDKINSKSSEIEFLNTIFMENGEEAIKIYLKLFENSHGDFKSVVSKKISDYYYAKGYYLTASKYQKYLVESTRTISKYQKNKSIQTENIKYIIQLGAFGLEENAVQLQEMLQTQNLYSRIEKRDINGKSLHCVWLDGKKEFSKTLEFAEKIKEKYHLQYRILQQ